MENNIIDTLSLIIKNIKKAEANLIFLKYDKDEFYNYGDLSNNLFDEQNEKELYKMYNHFYSEKRRIQIKNGNDIKNLNVNNYLDVKNFILSEIDMLNKKHYYIEINNAHKYDIFYRIHVEIDKNFDIDIYDIEDFLIEVQESLNKKGLEMEFVF